MLDVEEDLFDLGVADISLVIHVNLVHMWVHISHTWFLVCAILCCLIKIALFSLVSCIVCCTNTALPF